MATEQAGIPLDSAVAQQAHHSADAAGRTPEPESTPIAVLAALKPDFDSPALRAIGKAIGCVVRPYPIDDADPAASKRRVAVAAAAGIAAVAGVVIAVRKAR